MQLLCVASEAPHILTRFHFFLDHLLQGSGFNHAKGFIVISIQSAVCHLLSTRYASVFSSLTGMIPSAWNASQRNLYANPFLEDLERRSGNDWMIEIISSIFSILSPCDR